MNRSLSLRFFNEGRPPARRSAHNRVAPPCQSAQRSPFPATEKTMRSSSGAQDASQALNSLYLPNTSGPLPSIKLDGVHRIAIQGETHNQGRSRDPATYVTLSFDAAFGTVSCRSHSLPTRAPTCSSAPPYCSCEGFHFINSTFLPHGVSCYETCCLHSSMHVWALESCTHYSQPAD